MSTGAFRYFATLGNAYAVRPEPIILSVREYGQVGLFLQSC